MKYLCLIYHDPQTFDALSKSEYDSLVEEALAYRDDLAASGKLVTCNALQPITQATTLRLQNGHPSPTDGPFAETKEHLGGFFLIEARDYNEAIRIASKIPPLRLGSVEVRPIKELE